MGTQPMLPFAVPIEATEGWNPYYMAWAAFNGRTPEQQAERDGGTGHHFIVWISGEWSVFAAEHGANAVEDLTPATKRIFGPWLADRSTRLTVEVP